MKFSSLDFLQITFLLLFCEYTGVDTAYMRSSYTIREGASLEQLLKHHAGGSIHPGIQILKDETR